MSGTILPKANEDGKVLETTGGGDDDDPLVNAALAVGTEMKRQNSRWSSAGRMHMISAWLLCRGNYAVMFQSIWEQSNTCAGCASDVGSVWC